MRQLFILDQERVRTVEVSQRGLLEVGDRRIKHTCVHVWFQEAEYAVGFQDYVFGAGNLGTNTRHSVSKLTLARAHPQRFHRTRREVSRRIRTIGSVTLLGNCDGVICGFAGTRLAIGRADTVAKLGDLDCGPTPLRHGSDQRAYDAGFTYIPRMSTDDNDCHN